MSKIPVLGSVLDLMFGLMEDEEQKRVTEDAMGRLQRIGAPRFDAEDWSPTFYDIPDDISYKTIEEDPEIRLKQLQALENMQAIADNKISTKTAAQRALNEMQANRLARAKNDAVIADAKSRGVGGSGLEFALRAQAEQEAANRSMQSGLDSAAQAALERMQANQAYNSGLANVRAQDFGANSANTSIINKFNELNSQNKMAAARANTQMQNEAKQLAVQRKDRNQQIQKEFDLKRAMAENGMVPYQKGDISGKYRTLHNFNADIGDDMGRMIQWGMTGSSDMGGLQTLSGLTSMGGGGGGSRKRNPNEPEYVWA